MKWTHATACLCFAAAVGLAPAPVYAEIVERIVATVNDDVITLYDVRHAEIRDSNPDDRCGNYVG